MDLVFKFSIFLIFCSAIKTRHYYVHAAPKDDDLITSLPGLTFDPGFKQYSGFLPVTSNTSFIHYWLVESQGNPATDPLVLWLNGGPGCSSLLGFFEELGPFFPNPDGTTLFENVFSWNKLANVLFIESPHGVGYSYTTGDDYHYNDTKTAQENLEALIQFVGRFPEYKNRDFYITGESYGGVYVPTLTLAVIQQIQADSTKLPLNLVGMAVGNGILSNNLQVNSYVDLAFYRGVIGKPQYNTLKSCCPNVTNLQYCDFSSWLKFDPNDGIGYPNPSNSACGNEIYNFGQTYLWNLTDEDP